MSNKKNTSSDLQGITRLLTEATIGITDLVEAMHHQVVHPPFLPSTPIQKGITKVAGLVYNNIRWSTRFIGGGVDKALGQLSFIMGTSKATKEKEVLRAVLNGVIGDYLEKTDNPLQIQMEFRYQGKAIALHSETLKRIYPKINGKILLLVHGSCMHDGQWTRQEHNHGIALANDLNKTPVFISYNSGLHISTNGEALNNKIEALVKNWPLPVEELIILGHSMGGLVTRSATHYGQVAKKSWVKKLKKMIFLGTPHHGAPLEQAGNYLDLILETIPYTNPFARLGKIRSAGVTDLRYGNLVTEDWQNMDRFKLQGDIRENIPLPKSVACYCIAGVVGKESSSVTSQWLGDKMVPVKSALGQHENPDKNLKFKKKNTWVAYEHSHIDLLSSLAVYEKLVTWMA